MNFLAWSQSKNVVLNEMECRTKKTYIADKKQNIWLR